jgi:hypothetical protein
MALTPEAKPEEQSEAPPYMGPWVCFHCGEVCKTELEATDHFGLDENEKPACVQMLTETEKLIVEDRRSWRLHAHEAEAKIEGLEHTVAAEGWQLKGFGQDVRTVSQALLRYNDLQAQLASAETKVCALVTRLVAAGVPWVPMPHDDRTPSQILETPVEGILQGNRKDADVVGGLLALHKRMGTNIRRQGQVQRGANLLTYNDADTNTILDAALALERVRVAAGLPLPGAAPTEAVAASVVPCTGCGTTLPPAHYTAQGKACCPDMRGASSFIDWPQLNDEPAAD